jgi:hypothetical protein
MRARWRRSQNTAAMRTVAASTFRFRRTVAGGGFFLYRWHGKPTEIGLGSVTLSTFMRRRITAEGAACACPRDYIAAGLIGTASTWIGNAHAAASPDASRARAIHARRTSSNSANASASSRSAIGAGAP